MNWFNSKRHINLPEVVYELKPGGHYLIEYNERAVSAEVVDQLRQDLEALNIHVMFVPNRTSYVIFTPVPATVAPPQGKRKV